MRDITRRLEEQKLLPAEAATTPHSKVKELKRRISSALALHNHEANGNWIICDGVEYLASKGCKTSRLLRGLKHD